VSRSANGAQPPRVAAGCPSCSKETSSHEHRGALPRARGQATNVLFAVSSQEMYDLLVVRRGWSSRRYTGFVATTIENALL
jgi:hypothetical protein